ncbi:MAG: ATP synthase F1 subunit delta [Desulfobacterales bacterium]|nr:ATP synthase F1 subunit delta [Desulfobacterales bacterium]
MSRSKVSKRYAKALLSIGQEDGNYEQYGKGLSDFSGFCQENREFIEAVSNRVFPVEDRKGILNAILKRSDYSGTIKNFLNLLLDKNRLGAIKDISEYYERLTDEISNIARAEVISPRPLNEDATTRLQRALEGLTSKKIRMATKDDERLIGGIVVKIGDLVLDGSIKAQLEGLKESLKRGEYR